MREIKTNNPARVSSFMLSSLTERPPRQPIMSSNWPVCKGLSTFSSFQLARGDAGSRCPARQKTSIYLSLILREAPICARMTNWSSWVSGSFTKSHLYQCEQLCHHERALRELESGCSKCYPADLSQIPSSPPCSNKGTLCWLSVFRASGVKGGAAAKSESKAAGASLVAFRWCLREGGGLLFEVSDKRSRSERKRMRAHQHPWSK